LTLRSDPVSTVGQVFDLDPQPGDLVNHPRGMGTAVLTPLIMKLEHFLPLPHQDKDWLNGLAV
jgi:hypothetical protein